MQGRQRLTIQLQNTESVFQEPIASKSPSLFSMNATKKKKKGRPIWSWNEVITTPMEKY